MKLSVRHRLASLTLVTLMMPVGMSVSAMAQAIADAPVAVDATKSFPTTGPITATPGDVEELSLLEKRVEDATKKAINATVGLSIGNAQGSGVIISADGYILTAAHVSGKAGEDVTITFADGRRAQGKTLGLNHTIDSGLIKLNDAGPYPWVEMGKSGDLKEGQWVIAMGHPGGYRRGRPPVLRLGRVIYLDETFIRTDNTLVGGDSGGPLLDLDAKVIGIHSRIGQSLSDNMHVPIDTYKETWERLALSEEWGTLNLLGLPDGAVLGVQVVDDPAGAKVTSVIDIGPAFRAGVKVDDVITKLGKEPVTDTKSLTTVLSKHKPQEDVEVTVLRGGETKIIAVTLSQYPLQPQRGRRGGRRGPQTRPAPQTQPAPRNPGGQNQGQRNTPPRGPQTRPAPSTPSTP